MHIRIQYGLVGVVVFLMFFLIDGVRFSFGVLFTDLLLAFPGSKASVAWVGAVSHGAFNFMGIVSGLVVRKIGCPLTIAIGSFLASVGALSSSFATSVVQLYFTYGILIGAGFNLATLGTIDLITHQFDRRRSFVMGVAMCGGGAGGFALNPLVRYLLDSYGWRGTLVLVSGIILHGVALGCLALLTNQQNKISSMTYRDDIKETDTELTKSMIEQSQKTDDNNVSDNKYIMSEIRNEDQYLDEDNVYCEKDIEDENAQSKPTSMFRRIFMAIIDPCKTCTQAGIHRNSAALIYLFGGFVRSFAYFIPLTYLPDFVVEKGFSPTSGAWVASLAGVTSCFARILIGWISDFRFINRLYMFVGCIAASGIVTMFCFFFNSFELIILYAVLYSIFFSGEISLTPIIAVDVSRKEDGSLVMGLLMTSCAVGGLFGTPLAGWLFDRTQSYDIAYSAAGAVILVSGLVLLPIKCVKRRELSRDIVVRVEEK